MANGKKKSINKATLEKEFAAIEKQIADALENPLPSMELKVLQKQNKLTKRAAIKALQDANPAPEFKKTILKKLDDSNKDSESLSRHFELNKISNKALGRLESMGLEESLIKQVSNIAYPSVGGFINGMDDKTLEIAVENDFEPKLTEHVKKRNISTKIKTNMRSSSKSTSHPDGEKERMHQIAIEEREKRIAGFWQRACTRYWREIGTSEEDAETFRKRVQRYREEKNY